MFLTKAADALLARLVPKTEAAAAPAGPIGVPCGYCATKYSRCDNGTTVWYQYQRTTDYYGNCTNWGAYCGHMTSPICTS